MFYYVFYRIDTNRYEHRIDCVLIVRIELRKKESRSIGTMQIMIAHVHSMFISIVGFWFSDLVLGQFFISCLSFLVLKLV